jgi:hypothetical protein
VQEIDLAGAVLDPGVPFEQSGDTLVFLLKGSTPLDGTRHFRVAFGASAVEVEPMVTLIDSAFRPLRIEV